MSCTPCRIAFTRMASFLEMVKDILPPREKEEARRVASIICIIGEKVVEEAIAEIRGVTGAEDRPR